MSFPVFLWRALAHGPKAQTSKAMVRSCGSLACVRPTHCHFKKHMGTECWACTSIRKHGPKRWCGGTLHRLYRVKKWKITMLTGLSCTWTCLLACFWDLSLSAGQSSMGLSLAVVVRLSQRYEACCFIGQDKVLRQGFCWRSNFCQSQMELHNTFNSSGLM